MADGANAESLELANALEKLLEKVAARRHRMGGSPAPARICARVHARAPARVHARLRLHTQRPQEKDAIRGKPAVLRAHMRDASDTAFLRSLLLEHGSQDQPGAKRRQGDSQPNLGAAKMQASEAAS